MTEPSAEALKVCPFCGEACNINNSGLYAREFWFVACTNAECRVQPESRLRDTEAEAITAWNLRAADQQALTAHAAAARAEAIVSAALIAEGFDGAINGKSMAAFATHDPCLALAVYDRDAAIGKAIRALTPSKEPTDG